MEESEDVLPLRPSTHFHDAYLRHALQMITFPLYNE